MLTVAVPLTFIVVHNILFIIIIIISTWVNGVPWFSEWIELHSPKSYDKFMIELSEMNGVNSPRQPLPPAQGETEKEQAASRPILIARV